MKCVFNWSGGKDSALALWYCQQQKMDVVKLLTTVSEEGRITMHGVDNALLQKQAKALNLPLQEIVLPHNCPMPTYSELMRNTWLQLKNEGIDTAVFGDIYLEDLRTYRDVHAEAIGVINIYPLWKIDTKDIANTFIEKGFKSVVVCVDAKVLDQSFLGRVYDQSFINDLPEGVDVCGENGEFHTFCFDGPIFSSPIHYVLGEQVHKTYTPQNESGNECFKDDVKDWNTGFWFQNLLVE